MSNPETQLPQAQPAHKSGHTTTSPFRSSKQAHPPPRGFLPPLTDDDPKWQEDNTINFPIRLPSLTCVFFFCPVANTAAYPPLNGM